MASKPVGPRYTIVNGTATFEKVARTGAQPGKRLRSGDMVV
jgi:hypothetical protein